MAVEVTDFARPSTQPELKRFFSHYPERLIEKGESLVQPGVISPVFLVVEGEASMCHISDSGEKLSLDSMVTDDIFPLSDAIGGRATEFYVEADDNLVVRVAPVDDFLRFVEKTPQAMVDIMKQLSIASDRLTLQLSAALEGDAKKRVVQQLTILRCRVDEQSDTVLVTEFQLASQTGLARETVSRMLTQLKNEGVIERLGRGRIRLITR